MKKSEEKKHNESLAKAVHDLRVTDCELKKQNDSLTMDKMRKINDEIDRLQQYQRFHMNNTSQTQNVISKNHIIQTKGKNNNFSIKKDITNYIRKGILPSESSNSTDGSIKLQVTSNTGVLGYNETYNVADSVYEYLSEYSVMRKICSVMSVSSDTLDIPMSTGTINVQWTDNNVIAPPSDNFVTNHIKTFEITAQPKVTQRMIEDVAIDVERFITEQLSSMFLIKEDEAFIKGDGIKQPNGILSYPAVSKSGQGGIKRIMSGSASDFDENALLSLYYSLPDYYALRGSFLMNKAVAQIIRTFRNPSNGQYFWTPSTQPGVPDILFGAPCYTSGHMPTVADQADIIVYGDFKRLYQIADRTDITLQRDPYTAKPFVIVYATKRVGGDVIDTNAANILRVGS